MVECRVPLLLCCYADGKVACYNIQHGTSFPLRTFNILGTATNAVFLPHFFAASAFQNTVIVVADFDVCSDGIQKVQHHGIHAASLTIDDTRNESGNYGNLNESFSLAPHITATAEILSIAQPSGTVEALCGLDGGRFLCVSASPVEGAASDGDTVATALSFEYLTLSPCKAFSGAGRIVREAVSAPYEATLSVGNVVEGDGSSYARLTARNVRWGVRVAYCCEDGPVQQERNRYFTVLTNTTTTGKGRERDGGNGLPSAPSFASSVTTAVSAARSVVQNPRRCYQIAFFDNNLVQFEAAKPAVTTPFDHFVALNKIAVKPFTRVSHNIAQQQSVFCGALTQGRKVFATRKGFVQQISVERRTGSTVELYVTPQVAPYCHPDVVSYFLETHQNSSKAALLLYLLYSSLHTARGALFFPLVTSALNQLGSLQNFASSNRKSVVLYPSVFAHEFGSVCGMFLEGKEASLHTTVFEKVAAGLSEEVRLEEDIRTDAVVPHRSLQEAYGCSGEGVTEVLAGAVVPGLSQDASTQLLNLIGIEMHRSRDGEAFDAAGLRVVHGIRRQKMAKEPLPWPLAVWAMHSDCTDALLDTIQHQIFAKNFSFEIFLKLRVPLWLKSNTLFREVVEKMANTQFQAKRDPRDAALLYTALGKKNVLATLFKMVGERRLSDFFDRDFGEDKNRAAASKNALASISKGNFQFGAAFFILAGRYQDAAHIVLERLNDWVLAYAILRLVDDAPMVGPLAQRFFQTVRTHVDAHIDHTVLEDSVDTVAFEAVFDKHDQDICFISHICKWKLGDYKESFESLVGVGVAVYSRVYDLLERIATLPQLKISADIWFPSSQRAQVLYETCRHFLREGHLPIVFHYHARLKAAVAKNAEDVANGAFRKAKLREKELQAQQAAVETGQMSGFGGFGGGNDIFGGMGTMTQPKEEEEAVEDSAENTEPLVCATLIKHLQTKILVCEFNEVLDAFSRLVCLKAEQGLTPGESNDEGKTTAFARLFVDEFYCGALKGLARTLKRSLKEMDFLHSDSTHTTETQVCTTILRNVLEGLPEEAESALKHLAVHHLIVNKGFGQWDGPIGRQRSAPVNAVAALPGQAGQALPVLPLSPALQTILRHAAGSIQNIALSGTEGSLPSGATSQLLSIALILAAAERDDDEEGLAGALCAFLSTAFADVCVSGNFGVLHALISALKVLHEDVVQAQSHLRVSFLKFYGEFIVKAAKISATAEMDWKDTADELTYANADDADVNVSTSDRTHLDDLRYLYHLHVLCQLRDIVLAIQAQTEDAACPPSFLIFYASILATVERLFLVQRGRSVVHILQDHAVAHLSDVHATSTRWALARILAFASHHLLKLDGILCGVFCPPLPDLQSPSIHLSAVKAAQSACEGLYTASWCYDVKNVVQHNPALVAILDSVITQRDQSVKDIEHRSAKAMEAQETLVMKLFRPLGLSHSMSTERTVAPPAHGIAASPIEAEEAREAAQSPTPNSSMWNPFSFVGGLGPTSPRSQASNDADGHSSHASPPPIDRDELGTTSTDLFKAKKGTVYSFCATHRELVVSHQKGITEISMASPSWVSAATAPVVFSGERTTVATQSASKTLLKKSFLSSTTNGAVLNSLDYYKDTDSALLQSVNFVPVKDDEAKKVLHAHPTHPLYAAGGVEGVSLFACGGPAPLRSFKGSSSMKDCAINKVRFSHNGCLLAAADHRGDVNVWRVESETQGMSSLVVQAQPHKETTSDLLFLDEGSIMATVGGSKGAQQSLIIHDLLYLRKGSHPGVATATLPVDMKSTCMVHLTARNDILICGRRGEVCLFDLRNMRMPVYHTRIHDRSLHSVALHPTEGVCAIGASDGDIMLLHPSKGLKPFYTHECVHPRSKMANFSFESSANKSGITALQYIGDYLISSGADGRVSRTLMKTSA